MAAPTGSSYNPFVRRLRWVWLVFVLAWVSVGSWARPQVWVLKVEGEIGPEMVSYLRGGLGEAERAQAQAVILEFSTPGGYLNAASASRDLILDAQVLTVAWVHREAYSAGALLAIACAKIYFDPAGVMGAASPVYFDPSGQMVEAPEKVVSAVRKLFAATAEARGRDPRVAEAMVDKDVEIPGLVERGKLLTLTATEAAAWGYADGTVRNLSELLSALQLDDAEVVPYALRWIDRVVGILTTAGVAALLLTLGVLGLVVEAVTPGFGIPGIVGLACLGLFFWAHYAAGLAGWESLVFFLGGVIALLLEIFVFTATDFGLAGIVGLVLIGLGFYTAMVGPFTESHQALAAVGAITGALVVSIVLSAFLLTQLPRSRLRLGGVILQSAITGRAHEKTPSPTSPWVG